MIERSFLLSWSNSQGRAVLSEKLVWKVGQGLGSRPGLESGMCMFTQRPLFSSVLPVLSALTGPLWLRNSILSSPEGYPLVDWLARWREEGDWAFCAGVRLCINSVVSSSPSLNTCPLTCRWTSYGQPVSLWGTLRINYIRCSWLSPLSTKVSVFSDSPLFTSCLCVGFQDFILVLLCTFKCSQLGLWLLKAWVRWCAFESGLGVQWSRCAQSTIFTRSVMWIFIHFKWQTFLGSWSSNWN